MRAVHEAGKIGLKIEPLGATTSIARKMPLFCGATVGWVTSSSRIERMIENAITCVEPENGQLKPVAVWSAEPVRSTLMRSPSTSIASSTGRGTPTCSPSSSSHWVGARWTPSGALAISRRIVRSE